MLAVAVAACSGGAREPTRVVPQPPAAGTTPADAAVDAAVAAAVDAGPPPDPTLRLPEGVAPVAYDLRLEVDPGKDAFAGTVAIRIRLAAPTRTIWLHAGDLALTAMHWSGGAARALPKHAHELLPIELDREAGPGEITLSFAYTGAATRDQEGLFRQRQDGKWFLFSQAESIFARQFVPCFDEPRFKVPWKVTLVVPRDQVALANARAIADRKLPDGRHEIAFAEIAALPSYLLAIAVGPFVMIDGGVVGRAKIPFRVATWPSGRKDSALALANTPKIVAALEAYFDQPLPVAKLDLVAVPELFGAMEHPGLITFEASILLAAAGDDDAKRRLIRVAAHELAHQWTGNLVTPAWWDDLWLSEAFATYIGDDVSVALGGFDDVALRTQVDREDALAADAEARPRAIRHAIADGDDIDETFDAIAYEKGRAVLAMFGQVIGPDKLRTAMRAYVTAHARGSVTTVDFVAAFTAVSSPELGQALSSLIDHTGTPIVELTQECSAQGVVVHAHARDHVSLPVCVRYPGVSGMQRTCGLVGERTELTLNAQDCPAFLIGNADGDGYYQVANGLPPAPLGFTTPTERLAVGDDLAGAVRRGELAPTRALAALSTLAAMKDGYAALGALAIANALDPLFDDANRPSWTAWLATRFADRLRSASLLSPVVPVDRVLRDGLLELIPGDRLDAAITKRARAIVDRSLAAKDPDAEQLALALVISAGAGGRPLFDRVLARAKSTRDRPLADALIESLGTFGPALAGRLVEVALDPAIKPAAASSALATMLGRESTQTAAWQATRLELPRLLARLAGVPLHPLLDAFGGLCDRVARDELARVLEPHVHELTEGRATLDRMLAGIDRCVARRAAAAGDSGLTLLPR